ncbi:unnamed protein product [Nippostrongylus brasiliensis]|uniref:Retrovirus-related Pol polyprotein from transposon TNT 1-94 n=1 Tax=Nippostrongylus brasiliensis TaxID=27835 RepID=A0A0N4XMN3_NIPBR|nr:unnamed protein product [Nippostrongylus brasiliensis]
MAEVNWVGLQNHLKKESGNRARHLQFIAVEFNKDFFNFNVVSKILCSLPLRWWKVKGDLLDTFYDKVFTIISKCRQETYSVLLIPLLKDHKRRVKEASASDKYNFLVLKMRRIMTRSTHLYVCLLETKLPNLAFPERNHVVDLLVAQDTLLSQPLDLALSPNSLFHQRRPLNLAPPVANHFVQNNLCMPMLPSSSSLNSSIQSPIDFPITRSPLDLPPLSTDRMIGSNMFFLDGDH